MKNRTIFNTFDPVLLLPMIALLVLLEPASAQSGVYITTNQDGGHTLTNHSGKVIVLIAGVNTFTIAPEKLNADWTTRPAVTASSPFAHEYLFKQGGMAVGSSFVMDVDRNPRVGIPEPTVTFVQFIDGSQWGDPNSGPAQTALKVREAELAMLALLTAGTEKGFSSALAAPQSDPFMQGKQRKYRQMVAASGVAGALADAKASWAMAQSRSNLWTF